MKTRISAIVAAAMEGEVDGLPVDDAPAQAFDTSAHDAACVDVDDSHREVENAYNDTDTLEETAAGLEALVATLESLDAPLSPSAAVFMNIAAESHLIRVGLDMSDSPIIASFESEEGAPKATALSAESVKAKLKAIWEAVKRMFFKVRDAIFGFVQKIIDANEHMKTRAAALQDAVKKLQGKTAANAEVSIPYLLAFRLKVADKLDNLMGHLPDVVFLVEDLNKNPGAEVAQSSAFTLDILRAKDEAGLDAALAKFKEIKFKPPAALTEKHEKDGHTVYSTKELPGGTTFSVSVGTPKESEDGITYLKNMIKVIHTDSQTQLMHKDHDVKAKTLSLADIETVAKSAIEVANQDANFKSHVEAIAKEIEDLGKHNAEAKAPELGEKGAKKIGDAYSALVAFGRNYMRLPVEAAAYSARTLRAYLAYAEKSLAEYAPAEAKKEDEAGDKKDDVAAAA